MCDICHRTPHAAGCPNAAKPKYPKCPACGATPELFYCDERGRVVGCDRCLHTRDWWQVNEKGEET